ncbi:hypothetical protein [Streptomyces sp. Qhu_M48]|uniref:hypothetical protein n=1 Tax=Streptomyces sp. Qhu_M48 TaxID=3435889 RepID=UPI003F4F87D2
MIDEAVTAMRAGAEFPDDIGSRAADAHRDALEAESEVLGLSEGITSLRYHLEYLRTTDGAETALEALGKRLTEFLAEVKKPAADLNGARSAEEAVQRGGKAPAAWKALTDTLGTLRNIRQAQFDILRPLGDGQRLQQLREKGHFEAPVYRVGGPRGVDVGSGGRGVSAGAALYRERHGLDEDGRPSRAEACTEEETQPRSSRTATPWSGE